ncbi:MAG: tetratricopeptide repeat protein [Gemmatimonadota bacterium]|nr:tetratricopeptide repeat protein [Gemmatimonadota bacterium]
MQAAPESSVRTVTFLFTDVEGSTRAWERDSEGTSEALSTHDALLAEAIVAHGGEVFKRVGDAFCAAFPTALGAVRTAVEVQRALASKPGGLEVRMGLHTGSAERRDLDWFGPPLNRVARLVDAGHGGQILLSGATRSLVEGELPEGASLRDLGEHRLKDLRRALSVHQLLHPDLPADFPPLRSLNAERHNLPVQLTAFVGRQQELGAVRGRLESERLITLTGPGGTGKTRLALQVAAEVVDGFDDGVWLVELAPLSDPGLVPREVATALDVHEEADRPLTETIAKSLEGKRTLLVLDNCEHVIEAAARLAEGLLTRSRGLSILATSREPLEVPGEVVWPVAPLDASEAVPLFVDRARTNRPGFELTEANASAVAEICRRLDGIPLAIELAAARIRALSPEQIAERLDDRFALLTGGGRTALPHHRTLRAAVDWSHDLLEEPERILFRRLAVFSGGWTLGAAEAVAGDPGNGNVAPAEVLDLIARLVDKSLATVEETEEGHRYRFPETLRAYAGERLREDEDDVDAIRRRHRDWFLDLAREAKGGLETADRARWVARLQRETDNLRAAVAWSLDDGRDVEGGLQLVVALRRFWIRGGSLGESIDWLERGLAADAAVRPATRIAAMNALGSSLGILNRSGPAERWASEALRTAREEDDRTGVMDALIVLAQVAFHKGEYEVSTGLYEEGLAMARELGDERSVTVVLNNMGEIARIQGDLERARSLYLRILEESPVVSDPEILHFNMGQTAIELGEFAEARDQFLASLRVALETNPGYVHFGILGIAQALAGTGRHARAALLFGAAEAERERAGWVFHDADLAPIEGSIETIRKALDAEELDELWKRGRAMNEEEAVALALQEAEADGT